MRNTDNTSEDRNKNVPTFPQNTESATPVENQKDEISDVDDETGAGGDHPNSDDDTLNRWDPVKKSIQEKENEMKREEE